MPPLAHTANQALSCPPMRFPTSNLEKEKGTGVESDSTPVPSSDRRGDVKPRAAAIFVMVSPLGVQGLICGL